ncbi:BZ3500_MvSof-1268-A1-R1_Chr1-3g01771 [Microbotryum saponariae]|uniref:BZ3500_MvSof-1268-A1-R1_Chr1-3g01771 protein n=1 Tax=Microbotryum saponariae TaxID=289078 RepID=A0A2X0LEY8_9BASI|nr:BZ3500_MvSof-1268-A1-R1_Chr1-3g01771 [Microbotryum saponariae]SCZ94553.1 BZ3501_MvSof-1269-A2-R1_Chr1-3g01373 [Microbotryum saponariae]
MPHVVASQARQPLESSSSNWTAAIYPVETTDFSADLSDSAFGRHAQVEPAVDESFYIHYPGDDDHPHAGRPSSSHSTVASDPASLYAAAPTDNLINESSLSPLSEAILTPTDERPHLIDDRHWYASEALAAQPQGLPATHAVPQHPLSVKGGPAPPRHQQPSQPQHQAMPQPSLAARRHRPTVQPIAIVQPTSIGLGLSPRPPGRAQRPASAAEVDQFFDEVKDLLPGQVALPPTPTTPQVQRYHVAGVMLDAEEYSAYTSETAFAPHYVPSSSPTPMRAVYAYSPPSHGPSRVAMMPPSPAYAHPPHTAIGFGFNYTIAPSQPYGEQHVHYAHTSPPRPRSAPASPELVYDGFEPYPAQQHPHRRPSIAGAFPRSQHVNALQPSYYEAGYHPYAQVPRAHVRMQSHSGYSSSAPVVSPQRRAPGGASPTATTASSAPPTPHRAPTAASVPSPTRRPSMAGRKGKRSNSGAPTFINFTSVDAPKLLSGVAPSGTSKRKREETEQRRRIRSSATSTSEEATAPAEVVAT